MYKALILWIDSNTNGLATKIGLWKDALVNAIVTAKTEWDRIFPQLSEITKKNSEIIGESITHIISKMTELFSFPRTAGPASVQDWGNMMVAFYSIVGGTISAVTKSLDVLITSMSLLKDSMKALGSGDFGAFESIKSEFNSLMQSIQGTAIEDIAKWMDPLYWLNLRPETMPNVGNGFGDTSIGASSLAATNESHVTLDLNLNSTVPQDQTVIDTIVQQLQLRLNLMGVRVNP